MKLLKIGECSRLGCSNRRLDLGISRFSENIGPSRLRLRVRVVACIDNRGKRCWKTKMVEMV